MSPADKLASDVQSFLDIPFSRGPQLTIADLNALRQSLAAFRAAPQPEAQANPAPAPLTPLLFSRRMAIARKLGTTMDAAFNAIVREVELAYGIGLDGGM